ncbi:dTDP-4-dehydrorhamnose 3,5-epimerase family protein [Streptomyces diacarni]|uniref:dTDP-4-keto-6-deoxy-D-glucose epimerase n=1 Tax=Streptomyces diacarni TaxID=2800381 RepID=A0A367F6W0_9ACTN|nr:dTDP-4-dehydrorhamnose 3,5-epimerase family protein [Streptomyces diacarni]RCG25475.1 dTDP-4-keto-6-deoxy-D-glucose epimerase [Streptomyces diacarni]
MEYRELKVKGAFEFVPRVFPDARGQFTAPLQRSAFVAAVGHPLPAVAQTNCSTSRRGTLRGIHFTRTPPGVTKYVSCAYGRAVDLVVDLRVGSPTFMEWDAVTMGGTQPRAVYFPIGVGHAFLALEDDTVMSYLVSEEYVPEHEYSVSPFDPALDLPVPGRGEVVVSERDAGAPTVAEAEKAGMLPDYRTCLELGREAHREA